MDQGQGARHFRSAWTLARHQGRGSGRPEALDVARRQRRAPSNRIDLHHDFHHGEMHFLRLAIPDAAAGRHRHHGHAARRRLRNEAAAIPQRRRCGYARHRGAWRTEAGNRRGVKLLRRFLRHPEERAFARVSKDEPQRTVILRGSRRSEHLRMTGSFTRALLKEYPMKLTFSPSSPFARKVRIAAIELGLIDKIEFVPTTVVPGQPNDEYSRINPVKKLPALILDNGEVIVDSYVITEYLDELAGGGKLIPTAGPIRWKVKSDHSLLQGMLDSMLLCRYERMVRPEPQRWQAWNDDHWNRAWTGMARFERQADMLARPLDISHI